MQTYLHDGSTDLPAENTLERNLVHPYQRHALRLLLHQSHRDFHADKAGSDDDNIGILGDGSIDRLCIFNVSQCDNTFEVGSVDRDLAGFTAGGEDEVVVFDGRA